MGALNTYRDHVVHLTEGMEKATYLFLFQDPGHSGEKSKKVSHTNDDDSARRITELVEDVGTPLLR